MSKKRLIAIVVFVFVVGLCLVHLEGAKVRHVRGIAELKRELRRLDYEHWQNQAELARLRSPAELEERSAKLALGAISPTHMVATEAQAGQSLAAGE